MNHRLRRVSEILKRELGQIIHREITFPVPLVTISAVDITSDLKNAHVFVSAMGDDNQRGTILSLLEKNRATLQSELAKRIVLKQTPHLHFRFDESIERGTRVLGILDELGLNE
jgi:ribosome-binding factor A